MHVYVNNLPRVIMPYWDGKQSNLLEVEARQNLWEMSFTISDFSSGAWPPDEGLYCGCILLDQSPEPKHSSITSLALLSELKPVAPVSRSCSMFQFSCNMFQCIGYHQRSYKTLYVHETKYYRKDKKRSGIVVVHIYLLIFKYRSWNQQLISVLWSLLWSY